MDAQLTLICYTITGIAIIIGFAWLLLEAMNHPRYHCDHPECDREFFEEEQALGHMADMSRHKPRRTDL